ncbi:RNA-guided endonuclease InsQ/TnpB family protein [Aerosakkonema sp. BLCC-F183]|uniref:RNA-guided endonuclease InsQ/TnpB family protein n=1 Tax=Aerosakkonema sp. BLCC-F183 TaxID=3342834 RepID=UPI0035B940B2
MLLYEFKLKGKAKQYGLIDEAIRTGLFIRNKCIRYWLDNSKVGKYELSAYCKILASEFSFAKKLNSMARQASADRAWAAISRFYDNCKKKIDLKKEFPNFKKRAHSVEYKTTGWKLSENRKYLILTDGFEIGQLKLIGTQDLHCYQLSDIKRIRLVRRADGYYAQFCIACNREIKTEPTKRMIGLDVGLTHFYTDSDGNQVDNPRYLHRSEKALKRLQRRVSRKFRAGQKPSKNYIKAKQKLAKKHLKVSRQRKDWACKLAQCVIQSNDLIAYEDLQVRNMARNHKLAQSNSDVSWYQFRVWLEYFGRVYGKITVAVPPQYTSVNCSNCGNEVKKTLSARTHKCSCGLVLHRETNAAINILMKALSVVGHTGTWAKDALNAWGELSLYLESG